LVPRTDKRRPQRAVGWFKDPPKARSMNLDSHTDQKIELSNACTALWRATLSLMTAFMHNGAPAHRYLLARRIARNLATLQEQDCFSEDSRRTFGKLSARWNDKAERLSGKRTRSQSVIGTFIPNWFKH
jgi:hypothetical protein